MSWVKTRHARLNLDGTSLVDVVRRNAQAFGSKRAYAYLKNGEVLESELTFRQVDCRARAVASSLLQRASPGDTALLIYPSGLEFVVSFLGCLYAGVVAVPVNPPADARLKERLQGIFRDCQPTLALTSETHAEQMMQQSALGALWPASNWLLTDSKDPGEPAWHPSHQGPDDLAFLQYTSGSTSEPKGVMITHGNLLANQEMIRLAFGHDSESTFVSWLPFYHDMGLIGNLLQPLYVGAQSILMSPMACLKKPSRWLNALTRFKAHTTGAPNFAYEHCVTRVSADECTELDLSHLRIAYNGSEPVRAATLRRFAASFGAYGFRAESFYPCYGLAEATLLVSGGDKHSAPIVKHVARSGPNWRHEAGGGPMELVSCGWAPPGLQIEIVDPENHAPVPEGSLGEIWIRGASISPGYWREPELTETTFNARIAGSEATFLRSGDLGFVSEGELFVAGRLKELIVIRGQNHYPQDLEATVVELLSNRPHGEVAVTSLEDADEERLVVFIEVSPSRATAEGATICREIEHGIMAKHGVAVQRVVLLRLRAIPKTSSGKVQRNRLRELLLAGGLPVLLDSNEVSKARERALALATSNPDPQAAVKQLLAAFFGVSVAGLRGEGRLSEYGLDSLVAIRLQVAIKATLDVELSVEKLLSDPTIDALTGWVVADGGCEVDSEPGARLDSGPLRLTHAQQTLWAQNHLPGGGAAGNLARALLIRGDVSDAQVTQALERVVEGQGAFTFTFPPGRTPVHAPRSGATFDLNWVDASSFSDQRLREAAQEFADAPFRLDTDALLRVGVYRQRSHQTLLVFVGHHMIWDMWSAVVFMDRFIGQFAPHDCSAVRHDAYALAMREQLDRAPRKAWADVLNGVRTQLELPTDHARPTLSGFAGSRVHRVFPTELAERVTRLARFHDVTPNLVLVAAYQVLMSKLTGHRTFAVGFPVTNKARAHYQDVIGNFAELAGLPVRVDSQSRFGDVVREAKRWTLYALENGGVGADIVPVLVHAARDRLSPFNVTFTWHSAPKREHQHLTCYALGLAGPPIHASSLDFEPVELAQKSCQFDLSLTMGMLDGSLGAVLDFRLDLFDSHSMSRVLSAMEDVVRTVCREPDIELSRIQLCPAPADLHSRSSKERAAAVEPMATLDQLFLRQARSHSDAIAVSDGAHSVSYGELKRRSGRVAAALRARGVSAESVVAVLLDNTVELIASILGIVQAGGAYLAVDPGEPAGRVAQILADAKARVAITSREHVELARGFSGPILLSDELAAHGVGGTLLSPSAKIGSARQSSSADRAAYILYTSGSTGAPKGTLVSHANVVELLSTGDEYFGFAGDDVWTMFHAACFDFSVWEMWGSLTSGARLVVIPRPLARTPDQFQRCLRIQQVTILNLTPTALRHVLMNAGGNSSDFPSLRHVILGGEPATPELAEWNAKDSGLGPVLTNMFGITETTVHVTACEFTSGKQHVGRAGTPIGNPLSGFQLYVVDSDLNLTLPNVRGDICVGGSGVTRGYLNNPRLTAERYVPDPFGKARGARLYVSGDIGAQDAAGGYRHHGRRDSQLKIRGFRVEPGEIEAAIQTLGEVESCAVRGRLERDGRVRLVACYVCRPALTITAHEIGQRLRELLPAHLIPNQLVQLMSLPKLASGKLDLRALDQQIDDSPRVPSVSVGSDNGDHAAQLLGIVRSVLENSSIRVGDNFFEVGGDSISAIQVVAEARRASISLSVAQIYAHQTIERLSEASMPPPVTDSGDYVPFEMVRDVDRERLPAGVVDAFPLSSLQMGLVVQSQAGSDYRVYTTALQIRAEYDHGLLLRALQAVARRRTFLRTSMDMTTFSEPLQVVWEHVEPQVTLEDWRSMPADVREVSLGKWHEAEVRRPFDWRSAPLLRTTVHRLTDQSFRLTLCEPLLDGWSVATLITEILSEYASACHQVQPQSLPAEPSYGVFVREERAAVHDPVTGEYLRVFLENLRPRRILKWSSREPGPREPRRLVHVLDQNLSQQLEARASAQGVPVKSALLAAHLLVLRLLTGGGPVVSGLLYSGRPETVGGDSVVGTFNNVLPMSIDVDGKSIAELLATVFDAELAMLPYRRYPYAQVCKDIAVRELLEAAFVYTDFRVYKRVSALPGIQVEAFDATDQTYFDLTAHFDKDFLNGGLRLVLHYASASFSDIQVAAICGYYQRALLSVAAGFQADRSLESVFGPTGAESKRWDLPAELAAEAEACTLDISLGRVVDSMPDAIAVEDAEGQLTYSAMLDGALRIAKGLTSRGIGLEDKVVVFIPRSAEFLISVLGVLCAGACFVPVDVTTPPERLRRMLEDMGRPFVVHVGDARLQHLPCRPLALGDLKRMGRLPRRLSRPNLDQSLAYAMYTSGSSGRPKAVEVSHAALISYLTWAVYAYRMKDLDAAVVYSSVGFDLTLTSLLAPLLAGLSVHLPSETASGFPPVRLRRHGRRQLLKVTPSHLVLLEAANHHLTPSASVIVVGGEPLVSDVVAPWLGESRAVYNEYGPTEAVVGCMAHLVEEVSQFERSVPIGVPIHGNTIELLDSAGWRVPEGAVGEIVVSGASLARCYGRSPGLTAARFHPATSDVPGARAYWTGDMARRRPDNLLEFLGRIDDQHKIRGYRVESREVEAVLLEHPCVRDAVVVDVSESAAQTRLHGFVVSKPSAEVLVSELREFLRERLPPHMVPSRFHFLTSIPTTMRGKVDRDGLRLLASRRTEERRASLDTAGARAIAAEWQRALNLDEVGPEQNFFELGGDSVSTVLICSRLAAAGWTLHPEDFFERQTIAELEQVIRRGAPADSPQTGAHEESRAWKPTPLQAGILYQTHRSTNAAVYVAQLSARVCGALDVDTFELCWNNAIRRHSALRMRVREAEEGPQMEFVESCQLNVDRLDWSHMDGEQAELALKQFLEHDRLRRLSVEVAPMMRVTVARLAQAHFVCIWTHHHLVLDGASQEYLLAQVFEEHAARLVGQSEFGDASASDFRTYLSWLASQDTAASAAAWSKYLEGFVPPPPPSSRRPDGATAPFGVCHAVLSSAGLAELHTACQDYQVTPNTLFQGAWALLLSAWGASDDVVFGAVASVRPAAVPGAASMVGLLLNSLPVRINVQASQQAKSWLPAIQGSQAVLRGHAHVGASVALRWAGVPPTEPTFGSLFVFENLLSRGAMSAQFAGLTISDVRCLLWEECPLVLVVSPDRSFELELKYDTRLYGGGVVQTLVDLLVVAIRGLTSEPHARVGTIRAGISERIVELRARHRRWLTGGSLPRTENEFVKRRGARG